MAGRLILGVGNPALTATGKVDSGATLTYYRNHTTELQSIYSSADLDTPLPNPLSCDAAGRFPTVWSPNGSVYSVKWLPTGAAAITFDDITASNTFNDSTPPYFNVMDYGASTATDADPAANTAAIQAAETARAAAGGVLLFPLGETGTYKVNGKIVPGDPADISDPNNSTFLAWEGELGTNSVVGFRAITRLQYVGDAGGDAILGWTRDEYGTLSQSTISRIHFDANGLANHNVLFEMTDTAHGAPRREMENVVFDHCFFYGAIRADIMIGNWELNDISAFSATGSDINCDQWQIRRCLFGTTGLCAVKMVGLNIYSAKFDTCFFFKSDTNVTREIVLIGTRSIHFQNCFVAPLVNTTGGAETRSFIYGDTASYDIENLQAEEPRILYSAAAAADTKCVINHLTINDSRSALVGAYSIYDAGGNLNLSVRDSTLGYEYGGVDYYHPIKVGGPLVWENSIVGKFKTGVFDLANPQLAVINGRKLTDDIFVNRNFNFDLWSTTSYQNGTTADKACSGWTKSLDGSAQGTISRTTVSAEGGSRYSIAMNVTTAGSGVGVVMTSETFDAKPFRGKSLFFVITGLNINALALSGSNVFAQINTQSGQPGANLIIDPDSSRFFLYGRLDVQNTDTTINFQFSQKVVGTINWSTACMFLWDGDPSPAQIMGRGAQKLKKEACHFQMDLSADTAALTGDATDAIVPFNSIVSAYGCLCDPSTGKVTFERDGMLDLSATLNLKTISSSHTDYFIAAKIGANTYTLIQETTGTALGTTPNKSIYKQVGISGVPVAAGDQAEIHVYVAGGSKTVVAAGSSLAYSTFSGSFRPKQ